MPQETNLNVAPYFDDFDPQSNFYKILFKPGFPVQGRAKPAWGGGIRPGGRERRWVGRLWRGGSRSGWRPGQGLRGVGKAGSGSIQPFSTAFPLPPPLAVEAIVTAPLDPVVIVTLDPAIR